MSTDVNKRAEEYADEVRWVPPSMSVDELKNEMVKAHQAGFRAALECEEVRKMRTDLVVIRDFVRESHKRLLTQVIDGFDRLLEGVK